LLLEGWPGNLTDSQGSRARRVPPAVAPSLTDVEQGGPLPPNLCPAVRTIVGVALSRDGVTVARTGGSDENLGILAANPPWASRGRAMAHPRGPAGLDRLRGVDVRLCRSWCVHRPGHERWFNPGSTLAPTTRRVRAAQP
jgi:hypothetical protein